LTNFTIARCIRWSSPVSEFRVSFSCIAALLSFCSSRSCFARVHHSSTNLNQHMELCESIIHSSLWHCCFCCCWAVRHSHQLTDRCQQSHSLTRHALPASLMYSLVEEEEVLPSRLVDLTVGGHADGSWIGKLIACLPRDIRERMGR